MRSIDTLNRIKNMKNVIKGVKERAVVGKFDL